MKVSKLVITAYGNQTKVVVEKTTYSDVDLDISPAGLVVKDHEGMQTFFPMHMVTSARFADRANFKAARKDPDMKAALFPAVAQ